MPGKAAVVVVVAGQEQPHHNSSPSAFVTASYWPGGSGFAETTGKATEISTAVVSFGTATVAFDGTFDVRMATDDWN